MCDNFCMYLIPHFKLKFINHLIFYSDFWRDLWNSQKCGLHTCNVKFNTQNEEWITIRTSVCMIFLCIFNTARAIEISKEDVPTWCKQFYYDFFLINGLYMFRTFTCPFQEFLYIGCFTAACGVMPYVLRLWSCGVGV